MTNATNQDLENEAQDNFVEGKEPSELIFCLLLASAYLGLAKFCWTPLYLTKSWKLLFNVEGFFVTVAVVAILIGARPYTAPSSLQISARGIKYRGPYWIQRKTVNWDQVSRVYLSPELILVLYRPKAESKRVWPMPILSIYLAERDQVMKSFLRYCPIQAIIVKSPALVSWIILFTILFILVIWFFYLLTP
ncbi:hypothetical protein KF707_15165 [Candidatus Obscuribacterales bacterium]|jgi:hypothetical protein|nr:hypothetical protein [Candidatus Obscuribacterales bacterium]MBX3137561.1 hypothetical protein [Candidatus Obscuribacterales bacterium]MBX3152512.1 hypothetical protein [Candidatus Obscuribacterales bacterium]